MSSTTERRPDPWRPNRCGIPGRRCGACSARWSTSSATSRRPGAGRSPASIPPINLTRDDKGITLEALCPGVDRASLDISVVGDAVTIRGERKAEPDVAEERYHRRERPLGAFTRTVSVGERLDPDRTQATYTQRHPPGAARPRSRGHAEEDPDPELTAQRRLEHGDPDDDRAPPPSSRRETPSARFAPSRRASTSTRPTRRSCSSPTCPAWRPSGLDVVAERDDAHHPRTRRASRGHARLPGVRAGRLPPGVHPDRGPRHRRRSPPRSGTACCGSRSRSLRGCSRRRSPSARSSQEARHGHHRQGRSAPAVAARASGATAGARRDASRSATTSTAGCSDSSTSPRDSRALGELGVDAVRRRARDRRRAGRDRRSPGARRVTTSTSASRPRA